LAHLVSAPQGKVCGLCGNYDGNIKNDFTTRSGVKVVDILDFGNSWKVSGSCPDAQLTRNPCTANPYRAAWSQKQCSIINSVTFKSCHSRVKYNTPTRTHTHTTRRMRTAHVVTQRLGGVGINVLLSPHCAPGGPRPLLPGLRHGLLRVRHRRRLRVLLHSCGLVCQGLHGSRRVCPMEDPEDLS